MLFAVADKNDNAITDLELHFEYNGSHLVKKTDKTGQLILNNIPVQTKVRVFQLFKNKELNEEYFVCERDKAQYFYVAENLFEKGNMTFSLVNKTGQPIRNSDIRFRYENTEFEKITDHNGKLTIKDIKVGALVECKQMIFGKSLPWHKFKFDKEIDEYIIHGETTMNYKSDNENYEKQVRTKIKLVNGNEEPIPNAIIRVEYNGKSRNKYTNPKGEVQIDDVLLGGKIKAYVDVRGEKAEIEFICESDNEIHKLVLKSESGKIFLWLAGILILAGLVFLISKIDFSSINFTEKSPPLEQLKKDTLIIKKYQFLIKDKKTNLALNQAIVSLKYTDTTFSKYTDSTGIVEFKPAANKLPLTTEVKLPGYFKKVQSFILDSTQTIYINKDDSTDVSLKELKCGELTQSEGAKITIRTFNMKMKEGKFKLFYNMFELPDKIEVYNGSAYNLSENNLIYSSNNLVRGLKTLHLNFSSNNNLITIKVTGGTNKTKWLYKVFCAKAIIK